MGKREMMVFNWSFAFPEPVPKGLYYQKGSLYKIQKVSHLLKYFHKDCWPSVSQQAFQHSRRLYSPMNKNHQTQQKDLENTQ